MVRYYIMYVLRPSMNDTVFIFIHIMHDYESTDANETHGAG